jgi:hypothetical protein
VRVSIETTDGKTLCAIPATESGARSIVLVEDTKSTLLLSDPPDALTPKKPPTDPARNAIKIRVPFELLGCFGDCHHGPVGACTFFFRGKIITVSLHLGGYE